jgi:hypothetical protein
MSDLVERVDWRLALLVSSIFAVGLDVSVRMMEITSLAISAKTTLGISPI